jgi:hypothetical protein
LAACSGGFHIADLSRQGGAPCGAPETAATNF